MVSSVGGICALNLAFGTTNCILVTLYLRLRSRDLGAQFRDLQDRQYLPCFHMVSDIHVNLSNEPRHLGMNIHLLIGAEGARKSEGVHNRSPRHQCYSHWPQRGFRARPNFCALSEEAQDPEHSNHQHRNQNEIRSPTHICIHPFRTSTDRD